MINKRLINRIQVHEQSGEKLISNVRFALGIIYIVSVPLVSLLRYIEGLDPFPGRSNIGPAVFFLYSLFLFIYVRKNKIFKKYFKYIYVTLDFTILSAAIWIGCTYMEIAPPISFLSIQALFYNILICTGAFRFSSRCAYFSGIFASITYLAVVIINRNALDLSYYFELNASTINLNFPIYNEFFRVMGMLVTGWVTGLVSKRRLALFNSIIETETASANNYAKTMEQTRVMSEIIRKSTDDILLSSKEVYTTANNQAVSIQEIEATINENAKITGEIAEKTGNVADIASKMEKDVVSGFVLLGQNVSQMEDIKNKNDSVISGIMELGNKITRIRDIIKTISAITDQTKVIAFNAALEAASAGDHEQRFSAVASEVKRLADDIAVLAKQIRAHTEEIQSSSSALIYSSEESVEKINRGNNLIKELGELFYEIRSGVETTSAQAQTITLSTQKQNQSSKQINIAIAEISKGLSSFIQATRTAAASVEDLTDTIKKFSVLLNYKTGDLNDQ
ncbi:MAG: methyl-accepting chemotaxis protein [Treponema sp.]|jgi:methyl-accepting chemotaxis protein|nr:methyl-accepting chemotaxis protein [Treponema sp.]